MRLIPSMPFRRLLRVLKSQLPQLNFITLHYLYFIVTTLLAAIIFWVSSTPAKEFTFTDSLFLVISAMTQAGLNTVNVSTINTWQQTILFLLMLIGGSVFVSGFIIYIRRRAFENRFLSELEREHRFGRRVLRSLSRTRAGSLSRNRRNSVAEQSRSPLDDKVDPDVQSETQQQHAGKKSEVPVSGSEAGPAGNQTVPIENSSEVLQHPLQATSAPSIVDSEFTHYKHDHISFSTNTRFSYKQNQNNRSTGSRFFNMSGVGARPTSTGHNFTLQSLNSPSSLQSNEVVSDHVSASAGFDRNSAFYDLTYAERQRLGGTEYKAVVFLSWIIPIYFVIFQFLSALSLGAYISSKYASVTLSNGLNPWWVGIFMSVSAFNNNGLSLLDTNMTSFNESVFILLTMSMLILAGNTCFPIILRWFIWTLHRCLPDNEKWADRRFTLKFLMDHPRRCFTHLFPSKHTWWLVWSVITLNGIDCIGFIVLNIGNPDITKLSPGYEFLDGLFQAIAVRSGGFYVVNISKIRISLQVLYVTMMYISVYPIAITIRNSNIYEERSLGIYSDDPQYQAMNKEKAKSSRLGWLRHHLMPDNESSRRYFIQQQLRAQLAHDLWWLVLAVFLIMIVEGNHFEGDPAVFSVFNVIFETVSAYGTVGISVGVPNDNYSFCGAWHVLSKLILCAVMIRGRHRGLPVAIDKAVLLPQDHEYSLEEEDARIRRENSQNAGLSQAV